MLSSHLDTLHSKVQQALPRLEQYSVCCVSCWFIDWISQRACRLSCWKQILQLHESLELQHNVHRCASGKHDGCLAHATWDRLGPTFGHQSHGGRLHVEFAVDLSLSFIGVYIVRQRNSIFHKKRAIPSIENVFVYSDRYSHSDLKSDWCQSGILGKFKMAAKIQDGRRKQGKFVLISWKKSNIFKGWHFM